MTSSDRFNPDRRVDLGRHVDSRRTGADRTDPAEDHPSGSGGREADRQLLERLRFSGGGGLDSTTASLHARLVERALAGELVDVAYRFLDTPVGSILVAATPTGIVRIAFAREAQDEVLALLAERISPRVLLAPRPLDDVARQLEEYFGGRRRSFELRLDFQLARGFRRAVLGRLPDIAYGTTASYSALAGMAGRPKAVRAVGSACATNPIPIVVPCHRVVRSDGSLGGYGGGLEAKQLLLELEGAAVPRR